MFANSRALVFLLLAGTLSADTVRFKERCLTDLVAQVPKLLASQDKKTGRFGEGIWIVTDQNLMLPLAAAWSYKDSRNPYYHSWEVLEAVMAGGDALVADQDETGQWVFRKKDGSTWGKIYMPWTYSRWIRAFSLIRGGMPPDRRARWEKGLLLGYNNIAEKQKTERLHNIPAHHAMGLYFAGQVFDKPEWCATARDYLRRIAGSQQPDGYWSEHKGPVVNYGMVYVDALGVYEAVSHDPQVLPCLAKSAVFHSYFTYPDGTEVETVDERNPYHGSKTAPSTGFTFTPEGRSYVARQIARLKGPIPADEAASLLLWGQEGEGAARDLATSDFDYVLGSGDAAVRRRGPWFLVASAITSPVYESRWIQDRQNFVSVYHDKLGLVLGGGNTKLQPAWSNFTQGDTSLLFHKAGDENPKFTPPEGVRHLPTSAKLLAGDAFGIALDYGGARGEIRIEVLGPDRLAYTVSGDPSLTAHLTLLPHMGEAVVSASGSRDVLGASPFAWKDPGAWIEHAGWRLLLPASSDVRWPLLPHNPYTKDGRAQPAEGRIVVDASLAAPRRFVIEAGAK